MSPEGERLHDPFVPPRHADELLGQVLARGRALRTEQRRRRRARAAAPLALLLVVVMGVVVVARRPDHSSTLVQTRPGPSDQATTTTPLIPDFGTGLLPPPDLGTSGPGVTNSANRRSSTTSTSTGSVAPGHRVAPVAVFDLVGADGRYQTAVLRPGASGPVAITAATAERQWPALSPDGTRIAFNSTQGNLVESVRSVYELYVVNVDGSGLRQITASPLDNGHGSRWPSWAPDGAHLVAGCASNTANTDICTMRPDGSEVHVIAPASSGFSLPRWSPDGASVVVLQAGPGGSASPWVLDPTGRRAPRRAMAGTVHGDANTPATFSSDGSQILFIDTLGGAASGQPSQIDLSTGRSTQLAALPPGRMLLACGARQLLYRPDVPFGPAAAGDLVLVGLDGSAPTVVLPRSVATPLIPSGCAAG